MQDIIAGQVSFLQIYGYSLGSARETKGRLYRAKAFDPKETLHKRISLADEVVALILTELTAKKIAKQLPMLAGSFANLCSAYTGDPWPSEI